MVVKVSSFVQAAHCNYKMIGRRVSLQHLMSILVKQSMCDEGIIGMS